MTIIKVIRELNRKELTKEFGLVEKISLVNIRASSSFTKINELKMPAFVGLFSSLIFVIILKVSLAIMLEF